MWHHPTTFFHRRTRFLTEGVYRGADAVVAYGSHVKRFVSATNGVPPEKVFIAGQAVDPAPFERVDAEVSTNSDIIFVGQFKEYKGIESLLDAFELLNGNGTKLRLIGNGPLEPEIRRHAATLRGAVEIVGHVPQERLPDELGRARCLVLPSATTELDREPWGLVVNEAMHAGLPVVASDAVGAAAGGLVRDRQNGRIVPERDPEALAGALRELMGDPALAERLGAQARIDARAFNYDRMATAFEQAVEYAVASRARSAD
jgi:glycosyltransferase involved in cell wall biosynthesis